MCSSCDNKYNKQRSTSIFSKLFKHRHAVFTIPDELRIYFRQDRKRLMKVLLDLLEDNVGKDEKIYIFKCKKCHKLNQVPNFIVNECMEFFDFIKKKVLTRWIVHTVVVLCYPLI